MRRAGTAADVASTCVAMSSMSRRSKIVIGGSAGGVTAVKRLLTAFPAEFDPSVFIVLHTRPHDGLPSQLPHVLSLSNRLPAKHPHNGEEIKPGKIYIAVPDCHMVIEDHHIHVI